MDETDPATKVLKAQEIINMLEEAGFTRSQAVALTNVILGIRSGSVTVDDAELFLEQSGLSEPVAKRLSQVFFEVLAAA